MNKKEKNIFKTGIGCIAVFVIWTILIQTVNVQSVGETGQKIGFAIFNSWFHQLTGVHMDIYTVTDWLGLVPVCICLKFAVIGFVQMIQRKSVMKVDRDILILGVYYVLVIGGYLLFEIFPVNYRPIFIEGRLEASYPSSTTLLVLSVMPTLIFQAERRIKNAIAVKWIKRSVILFSLFMIIGRLVSGVHWFTDIVGGILLSSGLFYLYKGMVLWLCKDQTDQEE